MTTILNKFKHLLVADIQTYIMFTILLIIDCSKMARILKNPHQEAYQRETI